MRGEGITRALSVGLSLIGLSGCSLLVGGHRGIDPPNPPDDLMVTPEGARTGDDLVATFSMENGVDYEVGWSCEQNTASVACPSGPFGQTVVASQTAKGQRWTATVTPSIETEFGGYAGEATSASIVIANTRPVLKTFGLSTYHPFVNQTISARAGLVEDADGDVGTVTFTWLLDGQVAASGLAGFKLTSSAAAGKILTVHASADDGEEVSPEVEIGPMEIGADVTRWVQTLPDRTGGAYAAFPDPRHRRILFEVEGDPSRLLEGKPFGELWEYSLDTERYVRLRVEGDHPASNTTSSDPTRAFYDSVSEQVIVAQATFRAGSSDVEVYALDVSKRGSEVWRNITPETGGPMRHIFVTSFFDSQTGTLYVYGSGTGAFDGVIHSLNVRDEDPTWTFEDDVRVGDLPLLLPGIVAIPEAHKALVFGGSLLESGDILEGISRAVYELDLESFELTRVLDDNQNPVLMPVKGFRPTLVYDPRNRRVLVGSLDPGTGMSFADSWFFDLETRTFSAALPPSPTTLSFADGFYDEEENRVVLARAQREVGAESMIVAFSNATSSWESLSIPGQNEPRALSHGFTWESTEGFNVFGGRSVVAREEQWQFDHASGLWEGLGIPTTGDKSGTPGARYGMVFGATSQSIARFLFFGGVSAPGTLIDPTLWELQNGIANPQVLATLKEPPAPAREGAVLFRTHCDNAPFDQRRLGYIGGRDDSLDLLTDTAFLECPVKFGACTWVDTSGDGAMPSPRAYASVGDTRLLAEDQSQIVLFGGHGDSPPGPFDPALFDDLFVYDPCAAPPSADWVPVVPSGASPSGRYGHSMNFLMPAQGEPSEAVFIVAGGLGVAEFDAWLLHQDGPQAFSWELLQPSGRGPSARGHHLASWNPNQQALMIYGGADTAQSSISLSDEWHLFVRPDAE